MGIPDIETVRSWASLIRDIGLIIGAPVLIGIGVSIYKMEVEALKARSEALEAQNSFLRETQYDRAAALLEGQKKVYEIQLEELKNERDRSKEGGAASEGRVKQLEAQLTEIQAKIQAVDASKTFLHNAASPQLTGWGSPDPKSAFQAVVEHNLGFASLSNDGVLKVRTRLGEYTDQTKIVPPKGLFFSRDALNIVVFNNQIFAIYPAARNSPVYVTPPNAIAMIRFSDDRMRIIVTGTDNKEIRYDLDGKEVDH